MFFKRLLTILFVLISYTVSSQNKRLDSLLKLVKVSKDTTLLNALNEISWEYKSSNIDSAFIYANAALQEAKKLKNNKFIARSYNSLGAVFETNSNLDSAFFYHKKSLAIKRQIKDSLGMANSYSNIGIILDKKSDYLKALEYYYKALIIYEKKATSFYEVPTTLVNIGIVYKKQEKFNKVLEYYKKALKIYEENNFKVGVVIITGNIGSVFLKTGDYQKAIEYCSNAKKQYASLGYQKYIPYMEVNIAAAEHHLQQNKKAIELYKNVISAFEKQKNNYELASAKIGIAKPLIAIKKYDEAIEQLTYANKIAKKNNFLEFEVEALEQLNKVHFLKRNYREAYQYQKLYQTKKDSLFEQKKVKDINEILIKYETSKKEKEIVLQKELLLKQQLELKNKTLYSLLLGGALLLFGIVFFAIYKRNQLKRGQLEKEISLKDALATIKTQNRLQEQRLRISRDLHDNIGAQLTFIISSLDNLKFVTKDLDKVLKEKLSGISLFTSETIQQLRDTIWAMNKSEITSQDLHSRILSFIEKAKNTGIATSFEVKNNLEKTITFSSLEGMNIFRIVQEAINNAIKYAEAKHISVYLIQKEKQISVSIKDNGKGFDVSNTQMGNGLSNMEKKASEINGKVYFDSKINSGTTIKIIL